MSCSVQMSDSRIPETVVIRIDGSGGLEGTTKLIQQLEPILPELNWRTHFFIVPERQPDVMRWIRPIIAALARFVIGNEFVTYYVHPVVAVGSPHGTGIAQWKELLNGVLPFREQAYQQQSEARLVILPIIEAAPEDSDESWVGAVEYFRAHLAKPSVFLRGPGGPQKARQADSREIRFYVEPEAKSGSVGIIEQLWRNRVFEDFLGRVTAADPALGAGGDAALLSPCRSHLVIDQPAGKLFSCFHEWRRGHSLGPLENEAAWAAGITADRRLAPCAECFSQSLSCMTDSLVANDRLREGGRAHLKLALALSSGMQHGRAIEHASRAVDLAGGDVDRAAALICKGLCHLARREFETADSALKEAGEVSDDPGLVCYHRGRVQFEWRDYIEALDRFNEALTSGSTSVPEADLFFYMTVSHIKIGEYREARGYLERWKETGSRRPVMLFYSALCDVGEEKFESALAELRAAEKAGPADEDLGSVLFYIGFCLKELARYEEAIFPLQQAAAVDSGEVAIFNLLGFCFYKTKQHDEAVGCFERAIEIDPRSALDYANLATNLRELGRTEGAIANYRKALSLDRNLGFARDNLTKLLGRPYKPDKPNNDELR